MVAPTTDMRRRTFERDGGMCVSCGAIDGLEYQHRKRTGAGGSKIPLTMPDGVTSCWKCNPRYEDSMQIEALLKGWKVRGWVQSAAAVPVFYEPLNNWRLLMPDATLIDITHDQALGLMLIVYGDEYEEWGEKLDTRLRARG